MTLDAEKEHPAVSETAGVGEYRVDQTLYGNDSTGDVDLPKGATREAVEAWADNPYCRTSFPEGTTAEEYDAWMYRDGAFTREIRARFLAARTRSSLAATPPKAYEIPSDPDAAARTRAALQQAYARNNAEYDAAVAQVKEKRKAKTDAFAELDERHMVLTCIGGKCRVLTKSKDPSGRDSLELQSFEDFRKAYSNRYVGSTQLGTAWLNRPDRPQARTLVYQPAAEDVTPDLNLWRGYGVTATPGNWPLMRAHIRDVLAAGDAASDDYIMKWAAWAVQNPGRQSEVAMVFRGKRGTGKGTFCTALKNLFGVHGEAVYSARAVTGNFNAHMQSCSLLFADEAVAPHDKDSESVLKALITEPTIRIELKGINSFAARNCLSIVMASNENWCVPAGLDERRFAVFNVSDSRRGDFAYFEALADEQARGGLEAMLYDLQTMDLDGWHPRKGVPKTAGLAQQQLASLRGAARFVYNMLNSGSPLGVLKTENNRVFVSTTQFRAACGKDVTDTSIGWELRRCGGSNGRETVGTERKKGYWLPGLRDARTAWASSVGINAAWDVCDGWDGAEPDPEIDDLAMRHF